MGLKENFNQALKDLINKGGLVGSEPEEKSKTKSNLDSYLDMPSSAKNEAASHGSSVAGFDQASSRISMSVAETDWTNPPGFEDQTSNNPNNYASSQNNDYGDFEQQKKNKASNKTHSRNLS